MRRSLLWYLRLATSVISLTACVLLIALWVRSYWWLDYRTKFGTTFGIHVNSLQGQLRITLASGPFDIRYVLNGTAKMELYRETFALPNTPHRIPAQWHVERSILREFAWTSYPDGHKVIVPHWCLATICGVIAVAPWMRRFSLRTLLIAMTLIAGLLAIILSPS
jgi:hypothetical protein